MRENIKTRLLPIIALLVLVGLTTSVPVRGVQVYDYGFVKQVSWTPRGQIVLGNKTSSFTQDDRFVIGYVTAAFYQSVLTSQWYDPTGQLYYNQTIQADCATSPCTFLFWLTVADSTPATRPGLWRMDLLADGYKLYTAYFSITPVIIEDDYWNFNVTQSAPPRVHGDLIVAIHPTNQTWSSYSRYMPYAANLTAHESTTNRALNVTTYNNTLVDVDLGGARSDGYTFVLSFDLNSSSVLASLNGWYGGSFAFAWQDEPWEHVTWQRSIHPTPEAFNITLPKAATLVDIVGGHVMTLDYNVTGGERTSVSFTATVPPEQSFGWTLIYQDFTFRNSHSSPQQSSTPIEVNLGLDQPIPVIPLTFGALSLWTAIMSAFLLTASELLSPIYARTGLLVNRRRLRIAALILMAIFIALTAYQVLVSYQPLNQLAMRDSNPFVSVQ
jgi:hypothetical protein